MIGYHKDRNDLICQKTAPGIVTQNVTDSGTSDSYPMHVCSSSSGRTGNSAMVGLDASRNLFLCTNT